LLDKGIPGIIRDLESLNDKKQDNQNEYCNDRLTVYNSIKEFLLRCADVCEACNNKKSEFVSGNLRHLSFSAPETLAQAMQLILVFYRMQNNLDNITIRSLGGLDRLLYPFYKSDIENGRYTKEQLIEITKYFMWNLYCIKAVANLPFYICGMDENGNDATNEFTFLLLETYRELDIYDPKMHVMYHENINPDILTLILDMIREGKNSFVFINTPVASKSLENIGISEQDAKKVIVYGCYETAAEGTEVPCTCGGTINLVSSVECVIKGNKAYGTFAEFMEAVISELEKYTLLCMETVAKYEKHYKDVRPSLIMSPTFKSSRESGIDLYNKGAKYNNTSIVGAGMATLVDSLVAVKHIVYDEKIKTLDELRDILCSNWENNELLRMSIKNKYPKFGNNIEEADSIAVRIYERFANLINGRKNGRGGVFRCGMFSVDWRFGMGEKTGATPDGRFDGEPLSKNLASVTGQDKKGVTAYLHSILKFNSKKVPDGYVADVILHSSAVEGNDGMQVFKSLLSTFMKKNGFAVHFNILSPDTLINAQKEPEKYRNLQVRLCGWNVRFSDMSKYEQDEFIKQSYNQM